MTWEIDPVGDSCRLTVIHDGLSERADDQVSGHRLPRIPSARADGA